MTIKEAQDLAAGEWNSAFDYRAIRNGVQVGNILMLHLDGVNKRAMEIYSQKLIDALDKIAYPIRWMQKELKPGEQLNGQVAVQLCDNPGYLKTIAIEALSEYQN